MSTAFARPHRARTHRTWRFAAVVMSVALGLGACGSGGSNGNGGTQEPSANGDPSNEVPTEAPDVTPGEIQSGGTFTYGRPAAVTSLDLHHEITSNNAFAIDNIFEPLVSFDHDGEIIDWLAAEHSISDDQLTYSFTLREGLKFSDGTDVTAADVKFSLERHLEEVGPLPITAPVNSIEALSELEIEIVLDTAYTPFLSELSGFSNGVLPADFGGLSEEEFFQNPIGTGPFVVAEWDPNGDLVFDANEHYWQEGKPYVDQLVYKLVADDSQRIQQLQAGQLDGIESVSAANIAELEANADITVERGGSWAVEQIFFNTQNEYFADVNVRRAISYALDREGITAATTFGAAVPAFTLLPSTIHYSAEIEALDNNLEKAQEELAASGFPDGFEATILIASGNAARAQIAQIVQQAVAPLGIDITIESIELNSFRERFRAFEYDFMINSGQSDAADANGFITFQADPEGFSNSYWTHYTNDHVTELMHEGRITPDGPEREKIYQEIQQILADDAPYIPLYNPQNVIGSRANTHGVIPRPNNSVLFEDVWIDQD